MEQKHLKFPFAAPVFAAIGFTTLIDLFSTLIQGYTDFFSAVTTLLTVAVFAAMAVFQFLKRRDILPVCGCAGMVLITLLNMLANTISFFQILPYGGAAHIILNLVNGLSLLLTLVGYAAAAVVVLVCIPTPSFLSKYESTVKKFWFAPAAVLVLGTLVGCLAWGLYVFFTGWMNVSNVFSMFKSFFSGLIHALPWLLLCMWIQNPEDKRHPVAAASTAADGTGRLPIDAGHIDMILHVVLLIFVGPIWRYFWIYKTTECLNGVAGEKERSVLTELLLCLFVPFYWWYWIYKSCQRIDTLARMRGVASEITALCLILEILVGIVSPAIMQDKINTIIKAGSTAAV